MRNNRLLYLFIAAGLSVIVGSRIHDEIHYKMQEEKRLKNLGVRVEKDACTLTMQLDSITFAEEKQSSAAEIRDPAFVSCVQAKQNKLFQSAYGEFSKNHPDILLFLHPYDLNDKLNDNLTLTLLEKHTGKKIPHPCIDPLYSLPDL
jgi:hypothetical protein